MMIELAFKQRDLKAMFLWMKAGRAIWIVVISLILVVTVLYGILLNAINNVPLAILISALFFGMLVFLALFDVKEAGDEYSKQREAESNRKSRGLKRLSE